MAKVAYAFLHTQKKFIDTDHIMEVAQIIQREEAVEEAQLDYY